MMKQGRNSFKSMNLDYQDNFRAIMDFSNPYSYNFGRARKEHVHTNVFNKLQNQYNVDFFDDK